MTKTLVMALVGCAMLSAAPALAGESSPSSPSFLTIASADPAMSTGLGLGGPSPQSSHGIILLGESKGAQCDTDADCASHGDHMKCQDHVCVDSH